MSIKYFPKIVSFMLIYLLTANGSTAGGSSTVHIDTQTKYIEQHN